MRENCCCLKFNGWDMRGLVETAPAAANAILNNSPFWFWFFPPIQIFNSWFSAAILKF